MNETLRSQLNLICAEWSTQYHDRCKNVIGNSTLRKARAINVLPMSTIVTFVFVSRPFAIICMPIGPISLPDRPRRQLLRARGSCRQPAFKHSLTAQVYSCDCRIHRQCLCKHSNRGRSPVRLINSSRVTNIGPCPHFCDKETCPPWRQHHTQPPAALACMKTIPNTQCLNNTDAVSTHRTTSPTSLSSYVPAP